MFSVITHAHLTLVNTEKIDTPCFLSNVNVRETEVIHFIYLHPYLHTCLNRYDRQQCLKSRF